MNKELPRPGIRKQATRQEQLGREHPSPKLNLTLKRLVSNYEPGYCRVYLHVIG